MKPTICPSRISQTCKIHQNPWPKCSWEASRKSGGQHNLFVTHAVLAVVLVPCPFQWFFPAKIPREDTNASEKPGQAWGVNCCQHRQALQVFKAKIPPLNTYWGWGSLRSKQLTQKEWKHITVIKAAATTTTTTSHWNSNCLLNIINPCISSHKLPDTAATSTLPRSK